MLIKTNAIVLDIYKNDRGKEYVTFNDELGGQFKLTFDSASNLTVNTNVDINVEVKPGVSPKGGLYLSVIGGDVK